MSKRVHEIAKEHNLAPSEALARLRAAGLDVKSVSSGVDEAAAGRVLGGNGGGTARPAAPALARPAPRTFDPEESPGSTATPPPTRAAGAGPRRVVIDDGGGSGRRSGSPARGASRSGSPTRSQSPAAGATPPLPPPAAPVPRDPRSGASRDPRVPIPRDPRAGSARDPRTGSARDPRAANGRDSRASTPRDSRAGATPDPRPAAPRDARRDAAREERSGVPQASAPATTGGTRSTPARDARPSPSRAPVPRDPRSGASRDPRAPIPRDPRSGTQNRGAAGQGGRGAGTAGGRAAGANEPAANQPAANQPAAAAPEPAAAAQQGNGAGAPAQSGAEGAKGDQHKRPTRDSLQGERTPGAGGGGRRRVVIDSQASRRAPGGGPPGPGGQPPRRQRRGRRRRGVYDEEAESRPTNLLADEPSRDLVRINSGSTVKDVAEYLNVPVPEIMKKLMALGEMKTLTQTLSDESIEVLASELGKEVEILHSEDEAAELPVYDDSPEDLVDRPPVVTIMGHVDHGKTSLLDAIRETEVAAGEAGGITQHIGAYQIHHDGRTITFLDTPGHEAFTAMRARGAKVTDLAVIVVAADDGVKPQTQEAVDHAKEAGVPILVAVNKIDKEGADPTRVRTEMTGLGLQPVEWGGETEFVDVSARTKEGLDNLLDTILVMAEVEELQANPGVEASGSVIESKLDPGRGPVVTILIDRGTLRVGDALVAGAHWGRVRAMNDFTGKRTTAAKPGEPVEVLGFDGVPEAGEHVRVVEHERRARQLAGERATRLKSESLARRSNKKISLEDIAGGEVNELNLLVKADVAGSLEAIEDEIAKLPQDEVSVNVIRRAVGGVTESDVMLAAASEAVIMAFNVRPVGDARSLAEREGIEIRGYSVIYRAIEDLRQAMEGMLAPEEVEDSVGTAEVRQVFRASRVGTIAGSHVTEGRITRGSKVRLVRDGTVIYTGEIASLRRFNEDAREVAAGYECGVVLRDYADIKEGDVLEAYATRQVERELV